MSRYDDKTLTFIDDPVLRIYHRPVLEGLVDGTGLYSPRHLTHLVPNRLVLP